MANDASTRGQLVVLPFCNDFKEELLEAVSGQDLDQVNQVLGRTLESKTMGPWYLQRKRVENLFLVFDQQMICVYTYKQTYMHACMHACIHTYIHT